MKKLLGVTVLLALALALVPVHANAAFRGNWDPITEGSAFNTGLSNGCEQPSIRPGFPAANQGNPLVERYEAFSTRSTVIGSETVRSIWQGLNRFRPVVANILDARRPLLIDPAAMVSYADPAWSPDGKYLAYIETDGALTLTAIKVQEFMLSTTMSVAATPVGAPLTIVPAVPGVLNRSPDWKPDGTALCYASTAAGPSLDIWYVDVNMATATVGIPARATSVNTKAEVNPTWGPGNRIAYATNKFGPNVLEIVDLDDMSVTLAETNFASVSHNNPSFSPDGNKLYYDAPQNEDNNNNSDIWKLDIPTQAKCDIFFDLRGDADPDVSALTNTSIDGVPYNLFLCSTTGSGAPLGIWRSSDLTCAAPLPIGVALSPSTINLGSNGNSITVSITMPAETQAAHYYPACDLVDGGAANAIPAGYEGIKNRNSIIPSPTLMGLTAVDSRVFGVGSGVGAATNGNEQTSVDFGRRDIEAKLVALGLVNQIVPLEVTAYSNLRGREFQGFGYLRINAANGAGQAVRMEQNSPNPFNPRTKINFSVAKAGYVNVRVFNVRGELVKTIASGNYGPGSHETSWDGSTVAGTTASSGVYYAKASVADGKGVEVTTDTIKMVLAK